MKTLLTVVATLFLALLSSAAIAAPVCDSASASSLALTYSGGSVEGQFQSLSFYPDFSSGAGILTVGGNPIPVSFVRNGSADKNYVVTMPCANSAPFNSEYGCTSNLVIDPTLTKTTVATKTKPSVTEYSAWSAKMLISVDTDDFVIIVKLVNTINLTGTQNMCFGAPANDFSSLWYLANPYAVAAFCVQSSDCVASDMGCNPAQTPACGSNSECYCQNDPEIWVPPFGWGAEAIPDGPPCLDENGNPSDAMCLPFVASKYQLLASEGTEGGCYMSIPTNTQIFCMTQQMQNLEVQANATVDACMAWPTGQINAVGTCVFYDCSDYTGNTGSDPTQPWCAPWQPNGTCNSVCNQ